MLAHFSWIKKLDWILISSALVLSFLGFATIKSFGGSDYFFNRQIIWLLAALLVFILTCRVDWSFLKTNSIFLLVLYLFLILLLVVTAIVGETTRGAASWIKIHSVTLEPVELIKPILVLLLAKYFSKRHVDIARFLHLFISSLYAGLPFLLVLVQPDFGSAAVLGAIWLGMALFSGVKLRHFLILMAIGLIVLSLAWSSFLLPYQKTRVLAFLNPQKDIQGAGYQAYQSMIAVGSGQIFGKGIGLGTQSRLEFLPEHATDFIFAAFAEEWGFLGMIIFFIFWGILLWRVIRFGIYAESNFEKLYAAGLAIFLFFQSSIHIGMNVGLLPITGLGMPFMSYGGSSLVSLFFALGILESFSLHKKGIFIGGEERFKEGVLGA